ncbi:hypothetical protein Aab01nite_62200 [Paractinoplanes abujensis]|uniref:Alpha amylase inhibitor n=1 Tax=Paractinoplanes abujensis TaxID=882441 RepID=A0A7W7CR31_9ACTN|nr:hypothetical protein [Actinoplanes abujensis]MBB4692869.1 hypothetical protein [Actinoplanes abujensis]GID22630.1 hypothetical protein Aab01nite_62200 [Actinoplanes abujensis]
MRKTTKALRALAVTGAAGVAALSVSAPAAHAAPVGEPGVGLAAQCVSLTGTYVSGSSKYATARNICAGTYSVRFIINNWPDTGCFSIGGYATVSRRTGGISSPAAARTAYC